MRSRDRAALGSTARATLEWGLRVLVLAALGWMLWRETRPSTPAAAVAQATSGELRARLAGWSRDPAVRRAHAQLDGAPDDTVRDWIGALRRAGVAVSYDAGPLAPVAVAAEALADPAGAVRLLAAAPAGSAVAIADAVGTLDTLRAAGGGATLMGRSLAGGGRASTRGVGAGAAPPDSLLLRPVLVVGRAGWEGRFVVAALEERGWTVLARLAVAPGVVVSQGALGALDTARLAAVVALDTTVAPYAARIARFVRQGGGLVLAPEAAGVAALAALAPGRLGAASQPAAALLASDDPRRGLALRPVALRDGAVALERHDGRVALAAHRVGAGRVVQSGYEETWRWRMAGPDGAPEAHRAWWAGVVRAAAYAPPVPSTPPMAPPGALDDAPVARLIAALGPASPAPTAARAAGPLRGMPWWLFALVAAALLVEWLSRRARGAK